MPTKTPKSKRLWFAGISTILFLLIGVWALKNGHDLNSMSAYIAVTCIPLISYILGESYRPSKEN